MLLSFENLMYLSWNYLITSFEIVEWIVLIFVLETPYFILAHLLYQPLHWEPALPKCNLTGSASPQLLYLLLAFCPEPLGKSAYQLHVYHLEVCLERISNRISHDQLGDKELKDEYSPFPALKWMILRCSPCKVVSQLTVPVHCIPFFPISLSPLPRASTSWLKWSCPLRWLLVLVWVSPVSRVWGKYLSPGSLFEGWS